MYIWFIYIINVYLIIKYFNNTIYINSNTKVLQIQLHELFMHGNNF